jgi:hypothetical protein
MKKLLFFACCMFLSYSYAQNPIAEFYNGPEGYPNWTDEVKWNNKITMTNQTSGAANFAEFKAKRDLLYAQGGGVLYYPAGTYIFDIPDGPNDEGLMLKKGVVIVGQTPATDKIAVKGRNTATGQEDIDQRGLSSLPTKFVFTRRKSEFANDSIPKMWNCIGQKKGTNETSLGQNSHMGVAWIEMEFGYIYFGMDFSNGWGATWGTATGSYTGGALKQINGWEARIPNGTHFMDPFSGSNTDAFGKSTSDAPSKIFVFGVKMSNCTPPNYVCDRKKKTGQGFKHENGGWRFGARIGIDAKYVFLANNVIDKPTKAFGYQAPTSAYHTATSGYNPANNKWLVYDYANAIGIDVNKNLMSACANRALFSQEKGYYEPNIIIRDNWIYNHGNKGIEVAGKWVTVKGNVNYRHHLGLSVAYPYISTDQLHYAMDGWDWSNSESASDLMARFIDYGGQNLWFDDNRWCGTGSKGNDGEGILLQRLNGVEVYSVAITNNKQANLNNGELGYIGPWDAYVIGLFQGWNSIMGSVGAQVCGTHANYTEDFSQIENYNLSGAPSPIACVGTAVNTAAMNTPQDWQDGCPTNNPGVPVIKSATYNSNTGAVELIWDDVTGETAYRVDRRKAGTTEWYTIAYRPRNETKTSVNPTLPLPGFGYGNVVEGTGPTPIQDMNKQEW